MKYMYHILALLLPNVFFGSAAFILNVNRSLINLDYFFSLLLYIFGYRKAAIIVFIFLCFFDFVNIFSQIFPFIRFGDLFYLVKYAFFASPINSILPVFFTLFVSVYFLILNKISYCLDRVYILVAFNSMLLVIFLQNNFIESSSKRPWRIDPEEIVQSQILNSYELRSDGFLENFSFKGDAFNSIKMDSATKELFNTNGQSEKILLVVNESWGSAHDEKINLDVVSDIVKSKHVFSYQLSEINVDGFTINGEIRELCGKALNHFNLKDQKNGFEKCLPNLYKSKDYSTYAMHAATGSMYDRKYWYPKAGFQNLIFRETANNLKSRCYSFPGFCDRDLNNYIIEAFKEPKVFFYWLTLNTHVNYDLRDLKFDGFNCLKHNVEINSSSCRNLKLQKQFFYYLSQLIEKPELKGASIYVVGDHAPPIYGESTTLFRDKAVGVLRMEIQ